MTKSEKILKEIEEKMGNLSNASGTDFLIYYQAIIARKIFERLDDLEFEIKKRSDNQ